MSFGVYKFHISNYSKLYTICRCLSSSVSLIACIGNSGFKSTIGRRSGVRLRERGFGSVGD